MPDTDQPTRIIRLDTPRKGTQPTLKSDAQRLAQADPIAVRHSVGAAILRIRALAEAEGSLAQQIDAL